MSTHGPLQTVFFTASRKLLTRPFLPALLGGEVRWWRTGFDAAQCVLVGWGRRPLSEKLRALSLRTGIPLMCLEDGFIAAWGYGSAVSMSLVVDCRGIYYDASQESDLEFLLNSDQDLIGSADCCADQVMSAIVDGNFSKYNGRQRPEAGLELSVAVEGRKKILVVDQTFDDLSVTLGGAESLVFEEMLASARLDNPGALIFVKIHPEVKFGRKKGYLSHVKNSDDTVVLADPVNPMYLMKQMDRVYVVTSTMGFEALMVGLPVTCFGLPWYAGWGLTDDRKTCPRRKKLRTVEELFSAAYCSYTRYINPFNRERGSLPDVISWLHLQTSSDERWRGGFSSKRAVCVGFSQWRVFNLMPLLSEVFAGVVSLRDAAAAACDAGLGSDDVLVFWGDMPPHGLPELASVRGCSMVRMEDGFVRSVGLGSDLIRPLSLVLDTTGIYFDPRQPSDLDKLLNAAEFTAEELTRAERARAFIVEHGITKYNLEPRSVAAWPTNGKLVVLVPGQVEDDASIRLGCAEVNTNVALLRAARLARPDAFIVYKPHPDVMSGNRVGRLAQSQALAYADHVEAGLSVVSCIEACDEVHTMTSLAGFDALLRGKRVVTYGQPFYAGWGLTQDTLQNSAAFARRVRRLTLDELVAGALLRYPIYWDWELKGYTTCEAVLHRLVETRTVLEANGGLARLRVGYWRRQFRKLDVLVRAWMSNALTR